MNLSYTTITKIKLVVCIILIAIGLNLWFIAGRTVLELIVLRIVGMILQTFGTIGVHRWLSHNSFKPSKLGIILMLFGQIINGMGTILWYVISHTQHHKHSDTDLDPQTPKRLTFWDMLWGRYSKIDNPVAPKHLLRNKQAMFVSKHYWKLFFAINFIMALIDLPTAMLFCPLNILFAWVGGAIINYYGHNGHNGGDHVQPVNLSRWLWIIGFSGEELHKNHHANPSCHHFEGDGRKDPARWLVENILMKSESK